MTHEVKESVQCMLGSLRAKKPVDGGCCVEVSRSAINLIAIIIRFCMADELSGQALPVHHTNPYKNYNFQNDGTSRYFGL